jgi:hypothetical protein
MSKLLVTLFVVGSVSSAHAEEPAYPIMGPSMVEPRPVVEETVDTLPPLSGNRVLGEALLGGLFAVGGTVGGAYLGASIELSNGCDGELCGLGGAILGGAAGLAFVTPLGVYLVGSTNGETGSFGATLGGSVLGTLAGIGLAAASQDEGVALVALAIGPVAGSIIGFNLTRKYDRPRPRSQWTPVASATHERTTFGIMGSF